MLQQTSIYPTWQPVYSLVMTHCQGSSPPGLHIEALEKIGRWACELAKPGSYPSQTLGPRAQGPTGSDKAVMGLQIILDLPLI